MKRHWFRAKKYGYGWEPATWEGWLVLGVYVVAVVWVVMCAPEELTEHTVVEEIVAPVVVLTLLLVAISWRTGETPRWQWGTRDKEDVS